MKCPKCTGQLEAVEYADIHVHRCDTCAGLWCPPDELLKMKSEWMSEVAIDSGDPQARYNKIEDIECPNCGVALDKTTDKNQPHIWIETCPNGHGVFLDAGEFTDLKFKTFVDLIRDMLARRRT